MRMFRCLLEVERSLEERTGIACLYSIRELSPYIPENGVIGNNDAVIYARWAWMTAAASAAEWVGFYFALWWIRNPMWGCALATTAITAMTNTTIASNHST